MKSTLKPIVALLAIVLFAQFSYAHTTNDRVFGNALKAYDKVIAKNKKIFGKNKGSSSENADLQKSISPKDYKALKKLLDNAEDLFDQYIRVSTDNTKKKVARVYLLVLKKIDFSLVNRLEKYSANYVKINSISSLLNTVKRYSFPITYRNNSKRYKIRRKQVTDVERQLMVEFTKASALSKKRSDAVKWAKKAYPMYKYGDYNLWWSAHMWYYNNNRLYKRNADMVKAAENLIYAASGLRRSKIKLIVDSNYANHTHAYSKLNSILRSKPELSRNGEVWAKAAESFVKLKKENWATEYYKKALKAGYGNKSYLLKMMSFGRKKGDKDLVKQAAEIYDSKNLYSVSYSCTDYTTIADYFDYVYNENKAKELKDKYKKCQKALTKEQRRRARGGKFYVSFAPLAPISRNLQASIQIGGNRRLHEFGIKQTNSQRVIGVDDEDFRWGGLSYYYTYKKFVSRGFYLGFQARYTDRKYETISARVRNTTLNTSSRQNFDPTETRYDFTFHFGSIFTTRFFHIEYYTGFGLGYYTFNGGSAAWDNPNIEITDRDILNERGENPFGLTLRMGLQIGLNFINK